MHFDMHFEIDETNDEQCTDSVLLNSRKTGSAAKCETLYA